MTFIYIAIAIAAFIAWLYFWLHVVAYENILWGLFGFFVLPFIILGIADIISKSL